MPANDRQWVDLWRQNREELQRIESAELAGFVHDEHVDIIDGLLQMGWEHRQPRPESGLVELERWLAKTRG